MKKLMNNLFTFILLIISIIVFCITLYFCLDVFEIIDVPEKYSLVSIFQSKMEVVALTEDGLENIIDKDLIKKPSPRIVVMEEESSTNSTVNDEFWNALEVKLQNQENIEMTEERTPQNFYYEQLDEYAKIIYDELNANLDQLKTGTYTADFGLKFDDLLHQDNGKEILENSFQLAINAITFDNPDLFYIDVTKLYLLTEITTRAFSKKFEVAIGPNGESYLSSNFSSENSVNDAINQIENIKNELVNECQNKNVIEQIRLVHDYLVDNTEYDSLAGENIYNVYGTLINQRSVCEGYARSFKYIMDELNIPCIIACGIGKNNAGEAENHAWNYVQIEGKWYAIDVTWDDPLIKSDGILSNSKRDEIKNESKYDYFLKGSNKFFEDHFEDGNIVGEANFKYPTLSVLDYK